MRNIFPQKSCRKGDMEASSTPLFVFKKALRKVKASGQKTLVWTYFGRPCLEHTIITFQTVDPEIWSSLIFYKRVWD